MFCRFPIFTELLLAPFIIWIVEITEGIILRKIYKHNPAWKYEGMGVHCNGDIKLTFTQYKLWVVMYTVLYWIDYLAISNPRLN